MRGRGALDPWRTHAVQVEESLTDLAALADGHAVLALLPKSVVVHPFDGVEERPPWSLPPFGTFSA
jgi:hypothetical protein